MKPITREWIDKAEDDYRACARELRARAYDLASFLAQQAVEKYLKALLEEKTIPFPKTHDLGVLLKLAAPHVRGLSRHAGRIRSLSAYAIRFRYPGASATAAIARSAKNVALAVRPPLRRALGL